MGREDRRCGRPTRSIGRILRRIIRFGRYTYILFSFPQYPHPHTYTCRSLPPRFTILMVFVESEKENYDCAIGTSVLLTLLFAYDALLMGLPHLNFWLYLALPHTLLALCVAGYVYKRGIMHGFPIAYILGFTVFLALAFVHQQSFLRNQNDWRGMDAVGRVLMVGMKAVVAQVSAAQGGMGYMTIESGREVSNAPVERWNAAVELGGTIKDYWRSFINYTNHMAAAV